MCRTLWFCPFNFVRLYQILYESSPRWWFWHHCYWKVRLFQRLILHPEKKKMHKSMVSLYNLVVILMWTLHGSNGNIAEFGSAMCKCVGLNTTAVHPDWDFRGFTSVSPSEYRDSVSSKTLAVHHPLLISSRPEPKMPKVINKIWKFMRKHNIKKCLPT